MSLNKHAVKPLCCKLECFFTFSYWYIFSNTYSTHNTHSNTYSVETRGSMHKIGSYIRLGWRRLRVNNALAYLGALVIEKKFATSPKETRTHNPTVKKISFE
jgi:hypothetical protein